MIINAGGGSIADGSINEAKLSSAVQNKLNTIVAGVADDAVTTAKLANNAVTYEKLANNAVTNTRIANNAVTHEKLSSNCVQSHNIVDGSILGSDICGNTITSANILDGSILGTDISGNTITSANIADGAITNTKIGFQSITYDKIYPNAITQATIAIPAISNDRIFHRNIGGGITGDRIALTTILDEHIATGTITGNKIASTTISGEHIAIGTITEANLTTAVQTKLNAVGSVGNSSIGSIHIIDGSILGTDICHNTIGLENLDNQLKDGLQFLANPTGLITMINAETSSVGYKYEAYYIDLSNNEHLFYSSVVKVFAERSISCIYSPNIYLYGANPVLRIKISGASVTGTTIHQGAIILSESIVSQQHIFDFEEVFYNNVKNLIVELEVEGI